MRATQRMGFVALVGLCAGLCACGGDRTREATMAGGTSENSIRVETTAFGDGDDIPVKYTADGENVSPPLSWSKGPAGTKTYALVVDDPDAPAGTWVHWIAWNLPSTELDEGAGAPGALTAGGRHGRNSWGDLGWGGPQPPSGTHRYFFRVYALDSQLDLGDNTDRRALDNAMRGHQLARGELMGRYTAKK
jgi:Raf kinase inhibitor-like YbhB/YbcL family protein